MKPASSLPKYVREVAQAAKPNTVGIRHVVILHDDWCDLLNNRGLCNCRPEVSKIVREVPVE